MPWLPCPALNVAVLPTAETTVVHLMLAEAREYYDLEGTWLTATTTELMSGEGAFTLSDLGDFTLSDLGMGEPSQPDGSPQPDEQPQPRSEKTTAGR